MMKQLLEGRLAPITYEMGFLECDCATAANQYSSWQSGIQAKRGVTLRQEQVSGHLDESLTRLLPLTSVESRRFIFIPTTSLWTAFFDNGNDSTDAFAPISYLARVIKCRGLRVSWVPDDVKGTYPARILEIYAPELTEWLNITRTWAAVADGNKWVFKTSGTVQPYEQLENYYKDPVSERFTPRMLELYLKRIGLRPFEEDFYLPNQAILIEKQGPIAPNAKEFGLTSDG